MKNKNSILIGVVVLTAALLIGSYFMFFYSPYKFREDRPIKIFWLNSYHDIPWAHDEIEGFEEVFEKRGVEIEIKRFDMDFLRIFRDEEKQKSVEDAIKLIDEWGPDLIYASDDPAQEYVVVPYYLNTDMPVVFSGVNEEPEKYGYDKAKNAAGILERIHFAESINFFKKFFPYVETMATIIVDAPALHTLKTEVIEHQKNVSDVSFVSVDLVTTFEEVKERVLHYQDKVDALITFPFVYIEDGEGNVVENYVISEWFTKNSKIPEMSFWGLTVEDGMFSAVSVSPTEQGKGAGKLAYEILINGRAPSSFEFKPTTKGKQYINLKRAEMLGLKKEDIPSTILINSEIYEKFPWEKAPQVYPEAFPSEKSTGGKE